VRGFFVEIPMILELYTSGTEHPALYDCYLDKEGTLWGMDPPPPDCGDLVQIVMERDFITPNPEQSAAINFLMRMNEVSDITFFPLSA
jgi:hypothetical protein